VEPQQPCQENNEPQPVRSLQERSDISDDYVIHMNGDVNDIEKMGDPISYKKVIISGNSLKMGEAMEDELNSMSYNNVCDLVEIPTKYDSNGRSRGYGKSCS
jgi:hypothetical protein